MLCASLAGRKPRTFKALVGLVKAASAEYIGQEPAIDAAIFELVKVLYTTSNA